MDSGLDAHSSATLGAWILLQLLTTPHALLLPPVNVEEENAVDAFTEIIEALGQPIDDPLAMAHSMLLNFQSPQFLFVFPDDLGYWVKPRSTTWFSPFLMSEYDDRRWLEMFRMTKGSVFALADLLAPHVRRKDTKYRVAIPVLICVACTLFKLTHGASLFICSEMFAIGKSTVCSILRDVVHAVNDTLRHLITWPIGNRLKLTQQKFVDLCGLPSVVGAIEDTHVSISKPRHGPADYFYFKSAGYTLNCQAVVDSEKRFLDLYLGMPGSTNDSRVLRRSSLFHLAMQNNLFDEEQGVNGFPPYLIGDLGYPLLPWLMVPNRNHIRLSVAESLFNKKLRRGRSVVENAFGILKQTFRELLNKSDLDVTFLPDVILCCAILHNMLLGQSHKEVENLFQILRDEGLNGEVVDEAASVHDAADGYDGADGMQQTVVAAVATERRQLLGLHLSQQRQQVL